VGVGLDPQAGTVGFFAERSAQQADVDPALFSGSVVIILTADLGAVLHGWSTAEVHALVHETHSFQL
jgi:hypothetical protein